jgi:septal ring factor EnvC (AmiA/AmiB activator)
MKRGRKVGSAPLPFGDSKKTSPGKNMPRIFYGMQDAPTGQPSMYQNDLDQVRSELRDARKELAASGAKAEALARELAASKAKAEALAGELAASKAKAEALAKALAVLIH